MPAWTPMVAALAAVGLFAAAFLIAHALAQTSTVQTVHRPAPTAPNATALDHQLAATVAPLRVAAAHHAKPASNAVSQQPTAAQPPRVAHNAKPATKPAATPATTSPPAASAAPRHRHRHHRATPATTSTPPTRIIYEPSPAPTPAPTPSHRSSGGSSHRSSGSPSHRSSGGSSKRGSTTQSIG